MKVYKCLKVERNKTPEVIEIAVNKNDSLYAKVRKIIGAGLIEHVNLPYTDDNKRYSAILLDEEGKLINKEYCRDFIQWGSTDYIAGTFIVIGMGPDGEYTSLTENELKRWKYLWRL
ncbi:hypothetical protein D3C81_11190 [compost metagenome]